jgi:hypothetical protein
LVKNRKACLEAIRHFLVRETHGGYQVLFGPKKNGNPRKPFYVVILGVEMRGGHLTFLHINIGWKDAW